MEVFVKFKPSNLNILVHPFDLEEPDLLRFSSNLIKDHFKVQLVPLQNHPPNITMSLESFNEKARV